MPFLILFILALAVGILAGTAAGVIVGSLTFVFVGLFSFVWLIITFQPDGDSSSQDEL